MLRSGTLIYSSALCILLFAGCDTASQQQKKAANAQDEANNKIVEATQEASQKVVSAQAEADKKIAEAQANFLKLREDYRHTTANNLVEFDRKVAELEAKAKEAKGKAKAELETKLQRIRDSRAAFAAEYKTLEAETAARWDATKAHLDKQWGDLKTMVD